MYDWWDEDPDEDPYEDLHRQYFVYGTLRPECGNARIWETYGARGIWDGEVSVRGWVMRGWTIPYAEKLMGEPSKRSPRIVGAMILPNKDDDKAKDLRRALDALEGHPRHYKRVLVPVTYQNMTFKAWMYDGTQHSHGPLIKTGDFYKHLSVVKTEEVFI